MRTYVRATAAVLSWPKPLLQYTSPHFLGTRTIAVHASIPSWVLEPLQHIRPLLHEYPNHCSTCLHPFLGTRTIASHTSFPSWAPKPLQNIRPLLVGYRKPLHHMRPSLFGYQNHCSTCVLPFLGTRTIVACTSFPSWVIKPLQHTRAPLVGY